jgi:predicted MFS family arabinose efflux permease
MNIKQAIIKTNDVLVYILLTLVVITAALVAISGQPIYGTIVLLVGFVIVSVLSGFWIAVSQIADSAQRSAILQEQHLEAIKKFNRSLEAHRELQFPHE